MFFILSIILIFSYFDTFHVLDNMIKDSLFQSPKNTDTRIVIIGIDDYSLEMLGRWPWDRDTHAKLIDTLSAGNPAAIGFDILFTDSTADDRTLSQAIENNNNIILPMYAEFEKISRVGILQGKALNYPTEEIMGSSSLGHINLIPDEDGILRQALLGLEHNGKYYESFAYKLYERYMQSNSLATDTVSSIPKNKLHQMYIDFKGEPEAIEKHSYYDVLSGAIPAEYFNNKILLIGPYATGIADDYYYTSIAPQFQMYGVEVHANIIQNLLDGDYKVYNPYVNYLALFITAAIGFFAFRKLKMVYSFILNIGFILLYVLTAKQLYSAGIIVQIIYPVFLSLLFYVIHIIFRYAEEYIERLRTRSAFEKYVAPEVVNQILSAKNSDLGFEGIKKEITIMFIDIRGFTSMSEKLEPEDVVKILNRYLDICTQSIFEHNGTLDKFIGDATMAVFNAPLDIKDHELCAVKCALQIRSKMNEISEDFKSEYGYDIKPGIGINTGFAVVGNIGCKTRMDYTAIGDAVNTAARLESNALADQILISNATYQKVADKVIAPFAGILKVKGKLNELEIYQLEGVRENA